MTARGGRPVSTLLDRIRQEIRGAGPLTFARFMEHALYDPDAGYYARGPARIGTRGDYFTASDVGRLFGRAVARQLAEIDERIGPLDPFDVVEFGSGRGLLARDVLDAMEGLKPALARRLRYVMVDRSAGMREASRERVPEATVVGPDELEGPYQGAVIAVELFDALPVHRVRRRDGRLVEVRVDVDSDDALIERETAASGGVADLARRYGAAPEEGSEAEVSPASLAQLDELALALRRGIAIVVDYGGPAAELYRPGRRRGTLLAYRGHTTNEEFLERVGEQDLTAHVNFTALEDRARDLGLDVLGLTTQDRFLIANGILESFEASDEETYRDPARVRQRLQARQLMNPAGMGRTFKVLMLAKDCGPVALCGLRDPFAT